MFGFEEKPRQQRQSHTGPSVSNTSDTSTVASMDTGDDAGGIRSMFLRRTARTASSASANGRGTGTGGAGRGRGGAATSGGGGGTPAAATRGRIRLSGFGHVGMGGSVALCDPASGLAFAMVTNKVPPPYC